MAASIHTGGYVRRAHPCHAAHVRQGIQHQGDRDLRYRRDAACRRRPLSWRYSLSPSSWRHASRPRATSTGHPHLRRASHEHRHEHATRPRRASPQAPRIDNAYAPCTLRAQAARTRCRGDAAEHQQRDRPGRRVQPAQHGSEHLRHNVLQGGLDRLGIPGRPRPRG